MNIHQCIHQRYSFRFVYLYLSPSYCFTITFKSVHVSFQCAMSAFCAFPLARDLHDVREAKLQSREGLSNKSSSTSRKVPAFLSSNRKRFPGWGRRSVCDGGKKTTEFAFSLRRGTKSYGTDYSCIFRYNIRPWKLLITSQRQKWPPGQKTCMYGAHFPR